MGSKRWFPSRTICPRHIPGDRCGFLHPGSGEGGAQTRFRKNFALGIRGWADLRVAIADLSANRVITNAAGKQLKTTLEANLLPRS